MRFILYLGQGSCSWQGEIINCSFDLVVPCSSVHVVTGPLFGHGSFMVFGAKTVAVAKLALGCAQSDGYRRNVTMQLRLSFIFPPADVLYSNKSVVGTIQPILKLIF